VRIVHLSDIHVWRYSWNPLDLLNKRALGMLSLVAGRARRFRLERLEQVIARVQELSPDHVLITGDLTTTALKAEFGDAIKGLQPLLRDPARTTVIPGNHDRYTGLSARSRRFENYFGDYMPRWEFPWIRTVDERTAILGLDATRSHWSATGKLARHQLADARRMTSDPSFRPARLIVANHYPVVAPPVHRDELDHKRLVNAEAVRHWLEGLGPHLYCCGHVHAAWAFRPHDWHDHLSLNSGAPLLRDRTGLRPPGFNEITLHDAAVTVNHHAWNGVEWEIRPMIQVPDFFPRAFLPAPSQSPLSSVSG
jgi:3',5'-cyclic AMP phosphodiesterase CpdA